jgi:hypothetical protein
LDGRPTALRLVPSYGHTTKFTERRIRHRSHTALAEEEPRPDSGRCVRSQRWWR